MVKSLLDRIQDSLAKKGYEPRSKDARSWLRSKANSLRATPNRLLKDRERLKNTEIIGRMYY